MATGHVPQAIAVRISDLIIERNHALFAADIRVDALLCTRSNAGTPTTWTQRFTGIKDGQRLPLDNGLLYLGPVRDFVDITLWVSRDSQDSLALATLFAERATSPAFKDAASALLLTAGALAAPWVAAVGASAVLSRMAYELILGATGNRSVCIAPHFWLANALASAACQHRGCIAHRGSRFHWGSRRWRSNLCRVSMSQQPVGS
jgi:hypothetical protein